MDRDLAQTDPAQRTGVLPCRPNGVGGGLLVPCLVHDQHRVVIGESPAAQAAVRSRTASWSHTPRDRKCCSRDGDVCPNAWASVQQLRVSSPVSIASAMSLASSRDSRRGKQPATAAIAALKHSLHTPPAIVAPTATVS